MQKDFDSWNKLKQTLDNKKEEERLYFKDAEVWWVNLGINVGFEMDGKDDQFMRPVVVLKKHNKFSFLALPLTTSKKETHYNFYIGKINGRDSYANLSQIRNLDSKRLINKVGHIEEGLFKEIKKKVSETNLH